MPPLPPGHPPPSAPRATTPSTAEPRATTPAATPPSKAPPPHLGPPPSPASPYSPSSPASPAAPPPNRRPFNAFQTTESTPQAPHTPEDTDSDTSDGPPPWEQPVEVDNMAEVKYQGPVTIHKMIDPVPGPSFEDQANALPKRDKIIPDMPVRRDVHLDARLGHHPGNQRKTSSWWAQGVGTAQGVARSDPHPEESALDLRAAEPVPDD